MRSVGATIYRQASAQFHGWIDIHATYGNIWASGFISRGAWWFMAEWIFPLAMNTGTTDCGVGAYCACLAARDAWPKLSHLLEPLVLSVRSNRPDVSVVAARTLCVTSVFYILKRQRYSLSRTQLWDIKSTIVVDYAATRGHGIRPSSDPACTVKSSLGWRTRK